MSVISRDVAYRGPGSELERRESFRRKAELRTRDRAHDSFCAFGESWRVFSTIGYTCEHGSSAPCSFGDSGREKRASRLTAWLASTTFRQHWLCELRLFALVLACVCPVLRYYVQVGFHLGIPGWRWLDWIANWQWVLFEAFALLLAIVAAVFRARLWPIALPVSFLTFLLTYYTMVS
jgi:hypothetical protein